MHYKLKCFDSSKIIYKEIYLSVGPFSDVILNSLKNDKAFQTISVNEESIRCGFCKKKFNLLIRKHECKLCGYYFCSSCSTKALLSSYNSVPIRICNKCYDNKIINNNINSL